MPLMHGKSEKAFKENVKTEYETGKPLKQSLAIAYNMKRKSHKMASGGQITDNYESSCTSDCNSPCEVHEKAGYDPKEEPGRRSNEMAMSEDDKDLNQHKVHDKAEDKDFVNRIMKQRGQMLSEGGRVANDMDSNRDTDYLATDDDLEFNYTGANSGDELGNSREDDDRRDIVSRIMKQKRMRASMDGMSGYGRSDKSIK